MTDQADSATTAPTAAESSDGRASLRTKTRLFLLLGPAFVAAIAYVDPGNVAANVTAGASFGYVLLWVLLAANAMAVIVQYLSAKLGVVTGESLPEMLGRRLPRAPRLLFWGQAEVVAAATDIAEVIGGAIALQILFDLPLIVGALIVGTVSLTLLAIQSRRGARAFEFVTVGLLVVIAVGFTAGVFVGSVDWAQAAGGVVPRFEGPESVLLAASMLGATVMPHAIYAHSGLVRDRHGATVDPGETRRLLKVTRIDVSLSLAIAGSVNVCLLLLAAGNLFGMSGTDTIQGAYDAIAVVLGPAIAVLFGVALLASSLASTAVGCYAGSMLTSGLLNVQISQFVRRAITMIPALVILAIGVDPTWALVLSQVVLSIGIPFALIPLAWYTSKQSVMGEFTNPISLRVIVVLIVTVIVALNAALVYLTIMG